jgi:cytochrome c-type biogenesis protein CcmE
MNPTRVRRMWVVGLIVLGAGGAIALTLTALNQNIQHFFSPSDIADGKSPGTRTFRLGGIVEEGSVGRAGDALQVRFVVTDRFRTQPVEFEGILPDLFREGQSVVATGTLDGARGVFLAQEVLAKHDENYMPTEVADAIARAKERQVDATLAPAQTALPSPGT